MTAIKGRQKRLVFILTARWRARTKGDGRRQPGADKQPLGGVRRERLPASSMGVPKAVKGVVFPRRLRGPEISTLALDCRRRSHSPRGDGVSGRRIGAGAGGGASLLIEIPKLFKEEP